MLFGSFLEFLFKLCLLALEILELILEDILLFNDILKSDVMLLKLVSLGDSGIFLLNDKLLNSNLGNFSGFL